MCSMSRSTYPAILKKIPLSILQSVLITTKVVSLTPAHVDVYSIHHNPNSNHTICDNIFDISKVHIYIMKKTISRLLSTITPSIFESASDCC